MGVRIDVVYEGDLHCRVTHGPSGQSFVTDAPLDNGGKAASISPTDLAGASMGSCMLTIMGIYAKRHGIRLEGAKVSVLKEMAENPRRIARLTVDFEMPAGIQKEERAALERAALGCPVKQSFGPGVEIPLKFSYPD